MHDSVCMKETEKEKERVMESFLLINMRTACYFVHERNRERVVCEECMHDGNRERKRIK